MLNAYFPLLLTTLLTGSTPVFEAQKVEETCVTGELVELTPKRVVLNTPQGREELELAKLLFLLPQEANAAKESKESKETKEPKEAGTATVAAVCIELVDGSTLCASQYLAQADKATIALADGQSLEIPLKTVRNVRLQAESAKTAPEWARILGKQASGDMLVVRNGETLDYQEGVLRDVLEDAVRFDLDGEELPIKRPKIYGFAYRHASTDAKAKPLGYIVDRSGSRWAVADFALGEKLAWTTTGGVRIERPLSEIKIFDFSLGKVRYISDLIPESSVWTPFFGQGSISPAMERLNAPKLDRNFESKPLQIGKTVFAKGVAINGRTEIVYRLPGESSRFKAIAGIDQSARPKGTVRLVIRGDDRILLESSVTGAESPMNIDLNLTGVRRLSILVDFGESHGVGAHLILGNARIYQ